MHILIFSCRLEYPRLVPTWKMKYFQHKFVSQQPSPPSRRPALPRPQANCVPLIHLSLILAHHKVDTMPHLELATY